MPARQEASAARRKALHERRIAEATTAGGRLWRACGWLVSEARRANRLEEVTNAVLDLVERVRERLPLTDAPHEAPAAADPIAPHVPWYVRGDTQTDHIDRTERVA